MLKFPGIVPEHDVPAFPCYAWNAAKKRQ
jgi:hypothetical protein